MTFIVILMSLLIERFFDCSHLRRWFWVAEFQQIIQKRLPLFLHQQSGLLLLAFAIIPLLAIMVVLQIIFKHSLYGLILLLIDFIILLYCFGPRNLWADAFMCLNSFTNTDPQVASEKIASCFDLSSAAIFPYGNDTQNSPPNLNERLLKNIFVAANHRIFAVIFWFILCGPIGAVLYRIIDVLAVDSQAAVKTELNQLVYKIQLLLDYLPVRIFSALFAIGGHFTNVVACWSHPASFSIHYNKGFITECGLAALGIPAAHDMDDNGLIKSAIALIDRTLIVVLVILAVSVLIV